MRRARLRTIRQSLLLGGAVAYLVVGAITGGLEGAGTLASVFAVFAAVLIFIWSDDTLRAERLLDCAGFPANLNTAETKAIATKLGVRVPRLRPEISMVVDSAKHPGQKIVMLKDGTALLVVPPQASSGSLPYGVHLLL